MSLVTLKEILAPANEKNYAVAAFDTMDFTLTEGIIEAAEQTGLTACFRKWSNPE